MTRPRIAAIALDRPAQRPWPRTPLPPRLPQEAGQLGVPGHGKQALPNAPRPPAPVHFPSRVCRLRWCTAAHLSRHSRIPDQLAAQHHWYLVRRGPPSPPPRLRAGRRRRCQTAAIAGSWLNSASFRSIRVCDGRRRGTSFFWLIGFESTAQHLKSDSLRSIRVRYGRRRGSDSPRQHRPALSALCCWFASAAT